MLYKLCLVFLFVTVEGQTVSSFRKDNVQFWRRHGGDFENLFNVYDPSFLSVVWPKLRNGVHLLVELSCWDELTRFFNDLALGKAWAFDVVDASGRYPSGVFAGSRYWLGSKERCLAMSDDFVLNGHNETLTALRSNDYVTAIFRKEKNYESDEEWRWMIHDETMQALLAAEHRPPFPLVYTALQIQLNVTKFVMHKSYMITVGVCLPRSCSTEDVEAVARFSLALMASLRTNTSVPRVATLTTARQIDGHYDLANDTGTLILIAFTLVLLVLAIVATVVDLNLIKCFPYSKKSMSFDLPQYRNPETKLVDELKRKHTRVMNVDTLVEHATLNSIAMKKLKSCGAMEAGSCHRCGKYRRQCAGASRPPPTPRATYSSFASLSTEDRRNKFFWKLLLCFSIRNGLGRIFNEQTANRDLALIHGVKIFATFWVVFVHVAVVASYTSNNAGDLNEQEDVYYILTTGTLAFDTLFFVSGLISSHHFFYLKSRYSVKELVNFSGKCGQVMQFVCFVTNRVVRLLPSYAYMVAMTSALARASRAVAALPGPHDDRDLLACDTHWWRNLLYVTTAYPQREQCMQVSWFLSTETQLHALGALACAASASCNVSADGSRDASGARSRGRLRARLVLAVAAAFVLAAIAADLSEAYVDNETFYSNASVMYEAVIARPWARVAPYAAGLFTGWLVYKLGGDLTLNKTGGWLAWAASLVLGGGAVALSWAGSWRGVAWVACWQHAAWPAALLWPALLATTTYSGVFGPAVGGRGGAALARLSYGVLVSHAAAARLLLPDRPLYSDTLTLWSYFLTTVSGSVCGALVLAVLVEMPVCKLLRTLSDSAV